MNTMTRNPDTETSIFTIIGIIFLLAFVPALVVKPLLKALEPIGGRRAAKLEIKAEMDYYNKLSPEAQERDRARHERAMKRLKARLEEIEHAGR